MLHKSDIDKFYEDLKLLEFKTPVASVVEKTGYSQGTVSEYLSGRKTPSENFIKSFYEAFGKIIKEKSKDEDVINLKPEKLEEILRSQVERLIRIEATLEVYESALAGLLSGTKNDFGKRVGELRREVQAAVNRRNDELQGQ